MPKRTGAARGIVAAILPALVAIPASGASGKLAFAGKRSSAERICYSVAFSGSRPLSSAWHAFA